MITFGELRRLSLAWKMNLAAVERLYALGWLLHGIFVHDLLGPAMALDSETALGRFYFSDFPLSPEADLALVGSLPQTDIQSFLSEAGLEAARTSGIQFRVLQILRHEGRVEYTGPLGRRSAAQPRLSLRFRPLANRLPLAAGPLLRRFSDEVISNATAYSLEELVARLIAQYGQKPRARDLYALWFILTHSAGRLDHLKVRSLALQLSAERNADLAYDIDPSYRPFLSRAWKNALKHLIQPPSLDAVEAEIRQYVRGFA